MKKVGIIGGGMAGLTCAYKLAQKKVNSIVFEKESLIGGRVLYNIGAIGNPDLFKHVAALVKELDLEVLKNPLLPTSIGLLVGKEMVPSEDFGKMLSSFSKEEVAYYQKIIGFATGLSFDFEKLSPEIKDLRKVSFAEYLKECPEKIKTLVIDPVMNFAFEHNLERVAADYGLFSIKKELDWFSGRVYVFEENLMPLINVLGKKIKDFGSEILLSTEVRKVEKVGERFKINFMNLGREKTEIVDRIVFSTPLPVTEGLFPEMALKSRIEYKKIKCILLKGKLKYNRKLFMGIKGYDQSNIMACSSAVPYEHILLPFDPEKEVNFSVLYDEYKILGEKELIACYPVIPPKAKVPELKTETEGVYLCGDFYYYSCLEAAVLSGEMVAELILKE